MSKKYSQGLAVFLVSAALFAIVQFSSPNLVGIDGYYHIKMAYLMRTTELTPDFVWLPFSILNLEEFVDHHFLFHLLLIPFTFGDLIVGAKLASVIFASIAITSVWVFLENQKVPKAWMWSIGLFSLSDAFLFRMSMPRTQSLALAAIVLGMHWLSQKKYLHFAVLGFLFVWLFDGFPFFLILAIAFMIARWLIDGDISFRPLFYALGGIAAGLILHPYFPMNLVFAYKHLLPKLLNADQVSVGREWDPYTTSQLLDNSTGMLILLGIIIAAYILFRLKINIPSLLSLILLFAFGFLLMESRRLIEYVPPMVLIFSAISLANLDKTTLEATDSSGIKKIRNLMGTSKGEFLNAAVLVFMVALSWRTLTQAQSTVHGSQDYRRFAGAALFLQENSIKGERVFTTDWDDFPELFFHNNYNTYLIGLDPTYMHLYDSEIYFTWRSITRGGVSNPSEKITELYDARFVFSDTNHSSFEDEAKSDPAMIEVYRDKEAVIYEIILP